MPFIQTLRTAGADAEGSALHARASQLSSLPSRKSPPTMLPRGQVCKQVLVFLLLKEAALPWFYTTIIEEPTWLVSRLLAGPREKTKHFLQSRESKEDGVQGWVGMESSAFINQTHVVNLWSHLSKPVGEVRREP